MSIDPMIEGPKKASRLADRLVRLVQEHIAKWGEDGDSDKEIYATCMAATCVYTASVIVALHRSHEYASASERTFRQVADTVARMADELPDLPEHLPDHPLH